MALIGLLVSVRENGGEPLQFDPALVKRVDAFCDFYAQTAGAKPDWNDAAVALIDHALERNREFAKYLAEQAKPAA
ncbi:hypothetical protein [Xanthomonas campestris]|uniref:hypothetical protein n=1 Tax=Xanthomonas campestris TaxID=339 RepID=UPI0020C956EF|nr:hypothetical protein [Xanthomonas campestris]